MPNKESLKISVVTPSFNRGRFLEQNILSIKNQDYPHIEHIIIDSASTDNTLDILRKYDGSYNLIWVSEKDKGYPDGLNKGFAKATGDIVCWLDSDDFYQPGALKKVAEVFQSRPDVDVVFGDMYIVDAQGKAIDYMKRTKFNKEAMVYLGMIVSPQATFWRKSAHQKVGGLDVQYPRCSDYDFFCRLGLSGLTYFHLKEFLSNYRLHGDQLTNAVQLCRQEGDRIFQKFKDPKLTPFSFKLKKWRLQASRFGYFVLQGDMWYAIRSILIRMGINLRGI